MISDLTDDELRKVYQDWLRGDNTYTLTEIQKEYKKRKMTK